jgi:hypothetical protein
MSKLNDKKWELAVKVGENLKKYMFQKTGNDYQKFVELREFLFKKAKELGFTQKDFVAFLYAVYDTVVNLPEALPIIREMAEL